MDYYVCEVYRQDVLDQTHYRFIMMNREVMLDFVTVYHRASRRHKWRCTGRWSRISMGREPKIPTIEKPQVPRSVIAEVRKDLASLPVTVPIGALIDG